MDGLTVDDIDSLAPDEGEYVLVSRMRDGTQVSFSEQKILPRIQACIEQLEAEGVEMILFFCTGEFDYTFRSKVPLVFPCDLISRLIPVLCGGRQLIVVTPTQRQVEQSRAKWRKYVEDVVTVAASPYGGWEEIEQACREISGLQGSLVAMDCIGYSIAMKREVAEKTGKKVVLSRTMAARVISELSDI
ncbi:MAG: AroM family protein [Clostridia bacterium]|nr:AroM family protein [Clostridia bacterium]